MNRRPRRASRHPLAVWSAFAALVLSILAPAAPAHAAPSGWQLMPPPGVPTFGIDAYGADNVWVAGPDAVQWDGRQWTSHPTSVADASVRFQEVQAVSQGQAWAVGDYNERGRSLPWVGRWTGLTWQRMQPPQLSADQPVLLDTLLASGPDDVWLSYRPPHVLAAYLLHFDGSTWSQVHLRDATCPTPTALRSIELAPRRGSVVLTTICRGVDADPTDTHVLELVGDRFASRGGFPGDPRGEGYSRGVGVLPGGALVAGVDRGLQIRGSDSTWQPLAPAPSGMGVSDAYGDVAVDPTTGAVLAMFVGPRDERGEHNGSVCTWGRDQWACRVLADTATPGGDDGLFDIDVDPVTGTRWVLAGTGLVYRWVPGPP